MISNIVNLLIILLISGAFYKLFFFRNHAPVTTIFNETKNILISQNAVVAATYYQRSAGLLNHAKIIEDEALWILPAKVLHTKGMRFAIDIFFMDKKFKVTKIYSFVMPSDNLFNCIYGGISSYSAVELQAGRIKKLGIEAGDKINIS